MRCTAICVFVFRLAVDMCHGLITIGGASALVLIIFDDCIHHRYYHHHHRIIKTHEFFLRFTTKFMKNYKINNIDMCIFLWLFCGRAVTSIKRIFFLKNKSCYFVRKHTSRKIKVEEREWETERGRRSRMRKTDTWTAELKHPDEK